MFVGWRTCCYSKTQQVWLLGPKLLGPKCFLAYINDLHTPCPLFKYVDDSTICEICDRKSASIIQESVDITARWVEQNDMRINSVKSKEMIISFTRDSEF